MIKEELHHMLRHKWVIWLMVATILIPIFYSYCFLTSAWDPYGRTSKLPIAVVNLDQPTTLKGQRVNVGAQTVAKLRKDDQLGWHVTTAKDAAQGLKDNKYYAVITFPKDFSRDAATVLDKTPQQMHFTYKTNGSLNYIGEVMSQVGSDKLNDQIKAKVTQTYAQTFIQQIGSIGKQLKTAANGSQQITDGISTLQSGTAAMPSGVSQLATGSNQLTAGVVTYTNGVAQVHSGMSQLYAQIPTLSSGVSALYTGSGSLYKGLGQLYAQVPTLASGVTQLDAGGKTLASGVQSYTGGVGQVQSGLSQLQGNVPTLSKGVSQLNDGGTQLSDGLNHLNAAVTTGSDNNPSLASAIDQLNTGAGSIYSGANQLNGQVNGDTEDTDLTSSVQKLDDGSQQLADGISQMKDKMDKLQGKINSQVSTLNMMSGILKSYATLKANQDSANTEMQTAIDGVTDADQKAALTAAWAKVKTAQSSTLTAYATQSSVLSIVKTNLTSTATDSAGDPTGLQSAISQFDSALDQLKSGSAQINTGLDTLNGKAPQLATGIQQLTEGAQQESNGLQKLEAQVPTLTSSVQKLADGANQESTGLNSLNSQVPTLASGVNQLAAGANTLNSNSAALNSGAQQLSGGLTTLSGNIPTLSSGVSQLYTGSGQLYAGLATLNNSVPTLASGVTQLYDGTKQLNANSSALVSGSSQISGGLGTLNASVPTLVSGVKKLHKGSNKLTTGLKSGSDTIAKTSLTGKTAKMFAQPSKDTEIKYTKVVNYGQALAPYVLALALFIGIIIFNFGYPMRRRNGKDESVFQFLGTKLAVGTGVAVSMAVVEATLIMAFGLDVNHVAAFYGITILFALAAQYLTMLLNLAFNRVGIFIALALLTLSGSGGLFPAETISPLYESMQKFLPMTYAINGYREALTDGIASGTVITSIVILVVIAVLSVALMIPVIGYLIGSDGEHSEE